MAICKCNGPCNSDLRNEMLDMAKPDSKNDDDEDTSGSRILYFLEEVFQSYTPQELMKLVTSLSDNNTGTEKVWVSSK